MSQDRWVAPLDDNEILKKSEVLLKKFPDIDIRVNVHGKIISKKDFASDFLQTVKKTSGFSVSRVDFVIGHVNITYLSDHNKVTHLANVSFSRDGNRQDHKDQELFTVAFFKEFGVPPSSGPEPSGDTSIAAGYSKIEGALSSAVDRFYELQKEFQTSNENLRQSHLAEVELIREEVESERSLFQKENEESRAELREAQRQLDDRSNTHARRAIRTEIKDLIRESLESSLFSENTVAQRQPVRWAYWVFIVAAAAFTGFSSFQLSEVANLDSAAGIMLIMKAAISGFTTIGLALLYLKWETSWINQQAEFERVQSSTRTDIDRASWVVESLLEWNRDAKTPMPPELLSALTRRLFDWDAKLEDSQSSADSLASAILGASSNVKISRDGAELDINSRGIKKLAKDSSG